MATRASQIGQALRAAREAAGLTQKEASSLLGVDKQTISRWERGESEVRASDYNRALERYASHRGGRVAEPELEASGVGRYVSRGTLGSSGLPLRLVPVIDRFEREIIRMGADDFEVDHIRAVLRAPEMAKLFHMGDTGTPLTAEQQDAELGIQLEALRLWVTLHMKRRQPAERLTAPARKRGA